MLLCFDLAGKPVTEIPHSNRATQYADGFFTTVRIFAATAQLWQYHVARIQNSAAALYLSVPMQQINQRIYALANDMGTGVIKIHISRVASQARGYATATHGLDAANVYFFCTPQSAADTSVVPVQPSIAVACVDMPLGNTTPRLAGIKTLAKTEQVLATKALAVLQNQHPQHTLPQQKPPHTQPKEALLCNADGAVIEAISSNIFFQLTGDDRWHTPILTHAGVAGTMQAAILDHHPITHSQLAYENLHTLSALCLTNAVKGITPVSSIRLLNGNLLSVSAQSSLKWYENLCDNGNFMAHF